MPSDKDIVKLENHVKPVDEVDEAHGGCFQVVEQSALCITRRAVGSVSGGGTRRWYEGGPFLCPSHRLNQSTLGVNDLS